MKDTAQSVRILFRYAILTAAALGLVVLFRTVLHVNQTTVALAFLTLVLITASRWTLAYSVYLSVLCTLLYNFFFLPPVGRLTIADPQNWVALSVFLGSSILVGHLAERERQYAGKSEARRREVERLYEFSQRLLLQDDLRGLVRATPSLVSAAFGIRGVALYARSEGATFYSDPANETVSEPELRLAATQNETITTVSHGYRVIPLVLGMRSLGALAVSDGGYSQQIYEAIGSLVAIALERAAAVELSSRLEASRENERLRSALLDSVTHDLRTPLTAIRAATTTLISQQDLPEPERTELLTAIDEESARLDRLIGQAVEMAQIDADAVQLNRRPQNVRELVETTVEELRPVLRDRDVELEVAEDVPNVPMDRAMVHRVLRHLVENAVKYSSPSSPIAIRAARDEYRLLITVADQGPGIEPEEQAFVFDKFFRGKKQRAHATGTGMGLAIVKAILEAHGGGIELVSGPDAGTRFTLWLPLEPAAKGESEKRIEADDRATE